MTASNLYSGGVFRVQADNTTEEVFADGNSINNVFNIFEDNQGNVLITTITGIFYSTDGINFQMSTGSFSGIQELLLWDDPTTNRIYTAAMVTGQTAYSDDGGASWTTGSNPGNTVNRVFKVLHGMWSSSWPDGTFHSTDLVNWTNTADWVATEGDEVDYFEANGGLYYASNEHIYHSQDQGATWNTVEDGIDFLLAPVFNPPGMTSYLPTINFVGEGGKLMLSISGSMYMMDDEPISVKEYELDIVSIFPNPTVNSISIISNKEVFLIQILNAQGQLVVESNKTENIDVSMLSMGVYLVRAKTDDSIFIGRFVKQ